MINQGLIDQGQALIVKGESVLRTARPSNSGRKDPRGYSATARPADRTDYGQWSEWRSQSLSFLRRALGDSDTYAVHFDERCVNGTVSCTEAGLGVLRAVKQDMEKGNLARLPELVRADMFSDFIEMAEHLLATGYKDAAAVLGGGVLEQHLRLLCRKGGISTVVGTRPKKADAMNADLAKAGAYDTNRLKILTGWLAIRNSAAHGHFDEYTDGDVRSLLFGLREFVDKYPA